MSLPIAIEAPTQRSSPSRGEAPECLSQITLLCDDAVAAGAWRRALRAEGIVTDIVSGNITNPVTDGGSPAVDQLRTTDAIVLLLHGGLPAQLHRVRELRTGAAHVPLVVACSGVRELDQILALELGADDVIDAALSAPVVAARLRALWRRRALWQGSAGRETHRPRRLQFGTLVLSLDQRSVTLHGTPVELTEGEFEVLWLLAAQAGQTLTRHELLKRVRGLDDHPQDRSIDSRIYRIRAKLGDNEHDGRLDQPRIRTVRNRGYVFSPGNL